MIWKLFKLLASNIYNFSTIKDGFKKGPKGILKSVGIILLIGIVLVEFFFIFGSMILGIYNTLAAQNAAQAVPGVIIILSVLVTAFFAISAVSVSYYTGNGEEQLMSLPLSPRQLLSAKFLMSVSSELPMTVMLTCIGTIVYAYKEGNLLNPGIYVGMIAVSLASCIVILGIIYFIFVALLTLIPALRKK